MWGAGGIFPDRLLNLLQSYDYAILWILPHRDPRLSPLMAKLSSSFPISISTGFLRGSLLFPKNQGCVSISEETEKQDTLGYNWAYF